MRAAIDFGGCCVGDPAIAWTDFAAPTSALFKAAVAVDEQTWARARGWALWKALIVAAGIDSNQAAVDRSRETIRAIVAEHRNLGG